MAEFADAAATGPEDHARQYTAIEKAYVDDRWADVLQQGAALLASLKDNDMELRQRLELLMAHTYLYGFGDRDSAEDFYRSVLESKADPALRQIADQGLQQCNLPAEHVSQARATAQPAPSTSPSPKLTPEQMPHPVATPLESGDGPTLHESVEALGMGLNPSAPSEAGSAAQPAMPWLETASSPQQDAPASEEASGLLATPEPSAPDTVATNPPDMADQLPAPATATSAPSLIPDVIEEPEMIEVHQADPSLAEQIEVMESEDLSEMADMDMDFEEEEAEIPEEDPGFAEDPELMAGLLRVVIR